MANQRILNLFGVSRPETFGPIGNVDPRAFARGAAQAQNKYQRDKADDSASGYRRTTGKIGRMVDIYSSFTKPAGSDRTGTVDPSREVNRHRGAPRWSRRLNSGGPETLVGPDGRINQYEAASYALTAALASLTGGMAPGGMIGGQVAGQAADHFTTNPFARAGASAVGGSLGGAAFPGPGGPQMTLPGQATVSGIEGFGQAYLRAMEQLRGATPGFGRRRAPPLAPGGMFGGPQMPRFGGF